MKRSTAPFFSKSDEEPSSPKFLKSFGGGALTSALQPAPRKCLPTAESHCSTQQIYRDNACGSYQLVWHRLMPGPKYHPFVSLSKAGSLGQIRAGACQKETGTCSGTGQSLGQPQAHSHSCYITAPSTGNPSSTLLYRKAGRIYNNPRHPRDCPTLQVSSGICRETKAGDTLVREGLSQTVEYYAVIKKHEVVQWLGITHFF